MDYFDKNNYLKSCFDIRKEKVELKEFSTNIFNCPFSSPPSNHLYELYISAKGKKDEDVTDLSKETDLNINENNSFKYILIKSSQSVRAKDLIFIFHGLNERFWQKYLPWAVTLHRLTGKAIVLFPIAFHMNRAPEEWGNPRIMKKISMERINKYKGIQNSTFANAALSARLHKDPSRFFTSGFQTFADVTDLVKEIRKGRHKHIYDDASINFFGYSIGALFAEVLLMSNPQNNFQKSKLFIFCGGPTFDIMFPVAKAILDSEAYKSISRFFKLFDGYLNKGKINREALPEIKYFNSLLSEYGLKDVREERLLELKNNIFAVSLIKDKVVPPESVINTLNGAQKKIPIRTMITDFPYEYSHETPFPTEKRLREIVNVNFENIFDLAASYLG